MPTLAPHRVEATMKSIAGEQIAGRGTKYGILPGPSELKRMRERGMTQQQIAEEVERRTGHKVTRGAVTMALKRAGLSGNVRRYEDLIPWRVKDEHSRNYHLTMLRAEARRRRGLEMSDALAGRLEHWMKRMREEDLVVIYERESPEGFYLIHRQDKDVDIIRRPEHEDH